MPSPPSIRIAGLVVAFAVCSGAPLPAQGEAFARAEAPRELVFPADHASHPGYQTEWWYLTGTLETDDRRQFGLQSTWFRHALAPSTPERASTLATRDLILFHGGLTDLGRGAFHSEHLVSRAAEGWASASPDDLDVSLFGNRLHRVGPGWRLEATIDGWRVELDLVVTRPPLLHGEVPGWSRKGADPGESSYYASQTRLEARGSLRAPGQDAEESPIPVTGQLWFDHEFFSQQLAKEQVGWDWFAVALDDGTDLMLFHLRDARGQPAAQSSGTWRSPEGERRHLALEDFEIEVTRTWASPAAGPGDPPYPAGWILSVPSEELELRVEPLLEDQEHRSDEAGPIYWEGLSSFEGTRRGEPVSGLGYVELVGYRAGRPLGM